jgi:hypothetical protein
LTNPTLLGISNRQQQANQLLSSGNYMLHVVHYFALAWLLLGCLPWPDPAQLGNSCDSEFFLQKLFGSLIRPGQLGSSCDSEFSLQKV